VPISRRFHFTTYHKLNFLVLNKSFAFPFVPVKGIIPIILFGTEL
jgi:hypothetical protein